MGKIGGLRRRGVRKKGRKGGKSFYPPTFKELPPPMNGLKYSNFPEVNTALDAVSLGRSLLCL